MSTPPVPKRLARVGLARVSENIAPGQELQVSGAEIFALFRSELLARYVREKAPQAEVQRQVDADE